MTGATHGQLPALVFVHGFLDGAAAWDDLIADLGPRAAGALCVDLPGMGERFGEGPPYSLERFADDVGRQVRALGRPVVLVGHSMGAQVAELVAGQQPSAVRGLVLLTPVPLQGTQLPGVAMKRFHALGGQPEAQRELRSSLSVNLDGNSLERLGRLGDRVRPASVGVFADLWNQGHALGAQPSRYRGPVLVVRGAADAFITADLVEAAVTGRFEDPAVAVVGDAGHWPHVEQPQALACILAEFLDSLECATALPAVAPQGWTRAFEQKTAAAFADAFAPGMVLEASVLARPVVGADQVKTVMAAASAIYEALAFTHETTHGLRSYLEWEAQAFGGEKLYGVTILTKNEDGKVERAAIHHRPLGPALKFSAELGRRLQGRVDASHFLGAA
jgi:pimeloyl-ACP methyl ester carboxylesterase